MAMFVNSIWVDPESKKNLALLNKNAAAMIQEEPAAPAAAGAATADMAAQNNENLAMFEGLKGKAEEALQRQRDEETKKQSEHDMNVMSLKQAIALAENNVDDAKKERSRLAEEKAQAEGELSEVEASKAADEKSLAATTQECDETSAAWDSRQKEAKAEMA